MIWGLRLRLWTFQLDQVVMCPVGQPLGAELKLVLGAQPVSDELRDRPCGQVITGQEIKKGLGPTAKPIERALELIQLASLAVARLQQRRELAPTVKTLPGKH